MWEAKRRRLSHSPCAVTPIAGQLTDDTDMLKTMSKMMCMALSTADMDAFVIAVKGMRSRSSNGRIRFGSMCSGSGLGDLVLHSFMQCLSNVYPDLGDFECSFCCEINKEKAGWLKETMVAPLIFKDITQMGLEQCFDWQSQKSQIIPDTEFVFFGFSCKDLSKMNCNALTGYVVEVIERYTENPDAKEFQPDNISEMQGSTAPTLLGAMSYVRKHLPYFVLMENVLPVSACLPAIKKLMEKMGYDFFASDTMSPTMFACPNSRPRIYFGGRRRNSNTTEPVLPQGPTYDKRVGKTIADFAAKFAQEPPIPLANFMLDVDMQSSYFEQLIGSASGKESTGNEKWIALHAKSFGELGLTRPSADTLAAFADEAAPVMKKWLSAQALRLQEIAFYAALKLPVHGGEVMLDLSQSIDRANVNTAADSSRIHCFTEGSITWCVRARRFLSGRERLAMHGISKRSMTKHAPDSMLSDLAGNSFSATCFLVAFVAGLLG